MRESLFNAAYKNIYKKKSHHKFVVTDTVLRVKASLTDFRFAKFILGFLLCIILN